MSLVPFSDLPDNARVWVFGSDTPIPAPSRTRCSPRSTPYLDQWKAHGFPLRAAREWRENRFLVIGIDPDGRAGVGMLDRRSVPRTPATAEDDRRADRRRRARFLPRCKRRGPVGDARGLLGAHREWPDRTRRRRCSTRASRGSMTGGRSSRGRWPKAGRPRSRTSDRSHSSRCDATKSSSLSSVCVRWTRAISSAWPGERTSAESSDHTPSSSPWRRSTS